MYRSTFSWPSTSCRWVISFRPLPHYSQGKSPQCPFCRRLGGPQSRCGRLGEEKILDPTGTRTPTSRSSSPLPVAIPTTLSRLPLIPLMHLETHVLLNNLHVTNKRYAGMSKQQQFNTGAVAQDRETRKQGRVRCRCYYHASWTFIKYVQKLTRVRYV
jgi:hypothetical protein